MDLAILFWFYKEPDICENRLQLLKKYNPDLKIFGLFGGEKSKSEEYKKKLGKCLDDFFTFDADKDTGWKWINGDLMILNWYDQRGRNLSWDSVVVIQWDALVFDSLKNQFSGIEKGQIYLSSLKPVDELIEKNWDWIQQGSEHRKNYLDFLDYVKEKYNYIDTPMASLFILQVFPKTFFEKYLTVENKEIGMLEYKIPTYAKIFKIPFYEKDMGVGWFEKKSVPLDAIPREIPEEYIKQQLSIKNGWRIFHPYYKKWTI